LSEDVDGDGWVTKLPRKCVPRRWARWAERPRTQRGGRRGGHYLYLQTTRRACNLDGH